MEIYCLTVLEPRSLRWSCWEDRLPLKPEGTALAATLWLLGAAATLSNPGCVGLASGSAPACTLLSPSVASQPKFSLFIRTAVILG